MDIRILKINEVVYEGEARGVTVPATSGTMQILDGHKPVVATLKKGEILVANKDQTLIEIDHGYLEATQDQVTILL